MRRASKITPTGSLRSPSQHSHGAMTKTQVVDANQTSESFLFPVGGNGLRAGSGTSQAKTPSRAAPGASA
jgi:hypothetical protein